MALYKFQGRNDEELNFEQGERLDILQRPEDDPEWWKARNANGEVGLVPKNYVQVEESSVPPPPAAKIDIPSGNQEVTERGLNDNSLKNKVWYCGTLKRDESERTLMELNSEDGTFLIRESETMVSFFVNFLKRKNYSVHFSFTR